MADSQTLDINAATDSIGADLFGGGEPLESSSPAPASEPSDLELDVAPQATTEGIDEPLETVDAQGEESAVPEEVVAKPAPKAWPKEMHEEWGKVPPKVQDYLELREKQMLDGISQYKELADVGKTMQSVIQPYIPMLRASGADPAKAVEVLLNANYRLTTGPVESRRQAFVELGAHLGLVPQQNVPQEHPQIRELRRQQEELRSALTRREQQDYEAKRGEVTSQLEAFAKDHPHLDDVADDIVAFINQGHDLQTAYDKAVYANPVTRQQELDRIQKEAKAKLIEKGKAEAAAARKATAANVTSRDTSRAPTELMGTMEDTMRSTLRNLKSRTH